MKYTEMVVGKEYVVCGSTNQSFTFFGIHEDLEREQEYVTIQSNMSKIIYDFEVKELEDLDFVEVLEPEQDIDSLKHEIPGLSPAEIERLACLSEELGEAQQAIGKILRHGYASCNPDVFASPTNRKNLERELGDILCVIKMMENAYDVDQTSIQNYSIKKEQKLQKYLHHQESKCDLI